MIFIDIVIALLVGILPYCYLGFNLSNLIVCIIFSGYIFIKKRVKAPKNLLTIMIFIYSAYSVIQTICIKNVDSYVGIGKYLGIILVYITIYNVIDVYKDMFISKYIWIIGSVNIIYIIIQGIVNDCRINGLIGYSNTYALILLVCLGLCNEVNIKYKNYIAITLIVGIMYTGSRTTMIIMIIYQIVLYLENKKDNKSILNILSGILIYTFLESFLGLMILAFPIIYIVLKKIYNYNFKNYQKYLFLLTVGIFIFLSKANSIVRILNIGLNNGSLQERLVSFKDTFNALIANPLGYGINSFYYNIGNFKSSKYEIRYVHNSILDSSFEIGIIGGIILIIIFSLVIYKLLKSKIKISLKILGVGIIGHSMLDFDSAYLVFFISLFIYYFWNVNINEDNVYIKKSKILVVIVIACSIFMAYIEGVYIISRFGIDMGKLDFSKKVINLSSVKDWRIINLKGDIEFIEYKKTGNKKYLKNAKGYLQESFKINKNPITIENLEWISNELK